MVVRILLSLDELGVIISAHLRSNSMSVFHEDTLAQYDTQETAEAFQRRQVCACNEGSNPVLNFLRGSLLVPCLISIVWWPRNQYQR